MTIRIVTPLSLYRCRNLLNLRLDETKIICYTSLNYLNNLYYCVSKRKVPFWSARCSKYLNAVLYTYSLCVCLHAHDYNNFTDTKCRNEYTVKINLRLETSSWNLRTQPTGSHMKYFYTSADWKMPHVVWFVKS